ncbi:MAG TPA: hypothetical protein VKA46_07975 [Gemmataceae bacterium]|nr:hypothetical protein [Gemmataceae bacterium]
MSLSLVACHRLGQQALGLPLNDRVGGEAKRVIDAEPFAHVVQVRYAEGAVASKMQDHVGPNLAQAGYQVGHIVIGPQRGVGTAVPQGEHHELVVVRTGDDQGQVLVLVVVAVPEGQLLLAVGRVIDGVQVERQMARWGVKGGDELVEEHVPQPLEGLDGDRILEAGQRRLTGQVIVLGGAVGDELEDGVGAEGIVVVLVLVPGEDAVHAGTDHLQEGVLGQFRVAGVVEGVGEGPVSPMRWSNWRMGSSPASLESWPGDGSMTSDVPKKSRHWGQAGGILIG